MEMIKKFNYNNENLNIGINCYLDKDNQIWFRGKEIATILEYTNTQRAIRDYVDFDDKKLIDFKIEQKSRVTESVCRAKTWVTEMVCRAETLEKTIKCYFINESGFYSLIFSSKMPKAKEFKKWVTQEILPSLRKTGSYTINNNLLGKNNQIITTEYQLHCRIVSFVREKYPDCIMIAGLGENQKSPAVRISSYKKGYMAGQCDLQILSRTRRYISLCIEFKSPTGKYQISEKQKIMRQKYEENDCKYILSNDLVFITSEIIEYMTESRLYKKRKSYR